MMYPYDVQLALENSDSAKGDGGDGYPVRREHSERRTTSTPTDGFSQAGLPCFDTTTPAAVL